jgi:hypothetical protein
MLAFSGLQALIIGAWFVGKSAGLFIPAGGDD